MLRFLFCLFSFDIDDKPERNPCLVVSIYQQSRCEFCDQFYEDLVFTVTWSVSLGVAVVLGLVVAVNVGDDVERLLSLFARFDGDDAFICRIFIFEDCIQN